MEDNRGLVVYPMERRIAREGCLIGSISGNDERVEIRRLTNLFKSNEVINAYFSSRFQNQSLPNILTFSSLTPAKELYVIGKIMPIRFEAEVNIS